MPVERKGYFGRVGHKEATRVGVQSQLRIEFVEAKPLQVMVIRLDIHAVAAGARAVLCEDGEARAIRSGDVEGELVGFPSADAHSHRSNVPVSLAVQQLLELGVEIRICLRREIGTRADVNTLKAPVALVQHERMAPGHGHETFCGRFERRVESASAVGIQVGLELGVDHVAEERRPGDVLPSPEDEMKRAGAELHGAGEIEVLAIREEHADILQDLHQPHRDQDRLVPALPFDELRRHIRSSSGAAQCDSSGVEAVVLGERRCGR